jgi:hypothetical protein
MRGFVAPVVEWVGERLEEGAGMANWDGGPVWTVSVIVWVAVTEGGGEIAG